MRRLTGAVCLTALILLANPVLAQETFTIEFEGAEDGVDIGTEDFEYEGASVEGGIVWTEADEELYSSGNNAYDIAGTGGSVDFDPPVDSVSFFYVHKIATGHPQGTATAFNEGDDEIDTADSFSVDDAGDMIVDFDPDDAIARIEFTEGVIDSFEFTTEAGQGGGLITNLVMGDTDSAPWTIESDAQEGELAYTDRSSTISVLPEAYQGLDWIRTSNDSADWTGDDPIATFDVTADVTVYVAYDTRVDRPPCLDDWDDTGDVMENSGDGAAVPYAILSMEFASGSTVEMCKYTEDAGFYTIFVEAGAEPPEAIDVGDVAKPLGTGVFQLNVPFFLDVDAAGSSWGFVGLHNNLDTPLEIGVIYFNSEGDQLRFDANASPFNTAVIPAYASVAYRPVGDLPAALPQTIANRPQHSEAIADGEGDTKNNGAIVIMWDDGGAGALQGRYLQVNGADSSAYLLPAGVAVAK